MINLYVEKYCHECPDFEPKIEKEYLCAPDGFCYNMTNITCTYADRCKSIARYLEEDRRIIDDMNKNLKKEEKG